MCRVSIIMPVYNKEKYVEKAIRSVLDQTERDWELLIIDDGSTDNSYEICTSFDDERVKVFHVENGGVSKARNQGLCKAQGEYITFIDSDDYVEKHYLENLLALGGEIIIGGLKKVTYEGEVLVITCPKLSGKRTIKEVADGFYEEQTNSGIYGFIAAKVVRRKIIEDNHIRFDETIKLAEDYDFFLKVYHCVKEIHFTDYSGYCYIQETENSGITMDDSKIDFWKQIDIQKATTLFLDKMGCFRKKELDMYLKKVTGYVYTIFLLNSESSYAELSDIYQRLKNKVPKTWDGMQGMGKLCITLYDKNCKVGIFLLLKIRRLVRKICQK